MAVFAELTGVLGVPLTDKETEGLAQRITFLNTELDMVTMMSWLPGPKLDVLRSKVGELGSQQKVTLQELQLLVGHLNFECRVLAPGRAYGGCEGLWGHYQTPSAD